MDLAAVQAVWCLLAVGLAVAVGSAVVDERPAVVARVLAGLADAELQARVAMGYCVVALQAGDVEAEAFAADVQVVEVPANRGFLILGQRAVALDGVHQAGSELVAVVGFGRQPVGDLFVLCGPCLEALGGVVVAGHALANRGQLLLGQATVLLDALAQAVGEGVAVRVGDDPLRFGRELGLECLDVLSLRTSLALLCAGASLAASVRRSLELQLTLALALVAGTNGAAGVAVEGASTTALRAILNEAGNLGIADRLDVRVLGLGLADGRVLEVRVVEVRERVGLVKAVLGVVVAHVSVPVV